MSASGGRQLPRLDEIFEDQPVWSAGERKQMMTTNKRTTLAGLTPKCECVRWMHLVVGLRYSKPVSEICVRRIAEELFQKTSTNAYHLHHAILPFLSNYFIFILKILVLVKV